MKLLTILGALALTTSGTSLAATEAGKIKTFAVDGIHDYFFAMLPGIDGKSALTALTVSFEGGYKAKGIAGAFGPDIKFTDAELNAGKVVEIENGDFVLAADNKTDLALPLAETLALIATAKLGNVHKVDLVTGDTTTFEVSERDGTDLTVFAFGDQTYGVYANPDQTHVVALDKIADSTFRSKRLVDTFRTAELRGMVVDKQMAEAA